MEKNIWKDAFEQLNPSKNQKQVVWQEILAKQEEGCKKQISQKKMLKGKDWVRGKRFRQAIAAMACVAFAVAGIFSSDIMWGKIVTAWNSIHQQGNKAGEITENITDSRVSMITGYAPGLIECSEKRLIFAENTGLAVYDRCRETVAAVVDLQAIDCNYFDGKKIETRILADNSNLYIFNVKNDKPQGKCYRFDISGCNTSKGQVLEAVEKLDVTEELQKKWKNNQERNYYETFDTFKGTEADSGLCIFRDGYYSEFSLQWQDSENTKNISCLVIGGKGQNLDTYNQNLLLYTLRKGTKSVKEEKLAVTLELHEPTQAKDESLPLYSLVTDNALEQALVDFGIKHPTQFELGSKTAKEETDNMEDVDLYVPVVKIYAKKEVGKTIRVYGERGISNYVRLGNTLYMFSGGCGLYCAWLEKTEEGYKVKKMLCPRDGSLYYQDMIDFCDGDEAWLRKNVLGKYANSNNDIWKKRTQQLNEYLNRNKLELQIYE